MAIIDSQVHAYEANTPKRPWDTVPNWPAHVTGDEMVAAMDKVGVDGAIFISAFSMYRYDASYAVEVQRAHPGRFALVKPVDPEDPAVADVIADWKKTPGTVGIRIMMTKERKNDPNHPGIDRILREAVRHDFPVNMLCWGNLEAGTALIDRHPDTRFIIDHLGILQPRTPPAPRALGRSAEGAGPRQAAERGDQGERRLHAVAQAVSLPRYLGSARPRVRCLGFPALPVGHRLDARLRGGQLRTGRRAVPPDRPPEQGGKGDADGRCLRQDLRLVARIAGEKAMTASVPAGPAQRAPVWRRAFDWWLVQVKHVLPPTIFFFFGFNLILFTRWMTLQEHGIPFTNFFGATLAALLVGKAVLVVDNLRLHASLRRRAAGPADPVQVGDLLDFRLRLSASPKACSIS
jgi:hypothetical protein